MVKNFEDWAIEIRKTADDLRSKLLTKFKLWRQREKTKVVQRQVRFNTFEGWIGLSSDKSCDFLNDLLTKLEVTANILKDEEWPIIYLFRCFWSTHAWNWKEFVNDFLTKPKVRTCILNAQKSACSDILEGLIGKFCENLSISLT